VPILLEAHAKRNAHRHSQPSGMRSPLRHSVPNFRMMVHHSYAGGSFEVHSEGSSWLHLIA